jgi:hypothetical protein
VTTFLPVVLMANSPVPSSISSQAPLLLRASRALRQRDHRRQHPLLFLLAGTTADASRLHQHDHILRRMLFLLASPTADASRVSFPVLKSPTGACRESKSPPTRPLPSKVVPPRSKPQPLLT